MRNMKVVVADDEELACMGMRDYIPWGNFGLELAGCASNGGEALELICRTKAEILITDIMMPGMNGLELIEQLEQQQLQTIAVIVSAYDQFEYAQQAMRHHMVVDYILKPFDHRSFCECLRALPEKWNRIYTAELFSQVMQSSFYHSPSAEEEQDQRELQKLMGYIRQGKAEEALELAAAMRLHCESGNSTDFQTAWRIASKLTMYLEWTLTELGSCCQSDQERGEMLTELGQCRTEEAIRDYCVRQVEAAVNAISPRRGKRVSPIVRSCLVMIEENYSNPDFSLGQLALQLKASPNYISNKLKQETGRSFIKILNERRVERAKEMLTDITYRIYEICDQVGLRDPRYFTRVFKEYTGMTPTEYREQL